MVRFKNQVRALVCFWRIEFSIRDRERMRERVSEGEIADLGGGPSEREMWTFCRTLANG
jgi:hypothetical protein